MTENNYALAIRVSPATTRASAGAAGRLALERAVAADGMSVAQFIENALAGLLAASDATLVPEAV